MACFKTHHHSSTAESDESSDRSAVDDQHGKTAAPEPRDMWAAAEAGNIAFLEALPPAELSKRNATKDSILHIGAAKGRENVIEFLKARSVFSSLVHQLNVHNESPLHRATVGGHTQVVANLLRSGADADVNTPNVYGETPFYMACYLGHAAIAELLIRVKGCEYRESGEENQRPIDVASLRGHANIVKLIKRTANWRTQRLLWIGHMKEDRRACALARLPAEVITCIVKWTYTGARH